MNCSVLIVAEGEHELTGECPDPALITLVRRLLGDGIDMQATVKRSREVSTHMHAGKGDRLGRKFIGIVQFAEREHFDAVVILMDHDGDDSRLKSAIYAQVLLSRRLLTSGFFERGVPLVLRPSPTEWNN